VLAIYRLSRTFPRSEIYGLSSQFRRAAVSIAANIVEGFQKRGKPDKLRFFKVAQGSLKECRYYLILTKDLSALADPHGSGEYGDVSKATQLLEEVSKLPETYSRSILNSDS